MAGDTAERSLDHWSERGRPEMEAFYELAGEDYRQLALAADWARVLAGQAHSRWRLLDVACGSGRWPTALVEIAGVDRAALPPLRYDLLDPSAFSIAEARTHLTAPFEAGDELCVGIEDLVADPGTYDVVWAIHALYAVAPGDLDAAASQLIRVIAPGGLGVVAQATASSHYLKVYDAYRQSRPATTPFSCSGEVADALRQAGATVRVQELRYSSRSNRHDVVQGYLQRCLFDDSISLEQMEADPVLGEYLSRCRTSDGAWSFDHHVELLWF